MELRKDFETEWTVESLRKCLRSNVVAREQTEQDPNPKGCLVLLLSIAIVRITKTEGMADMKKQVQPDSTQVTTDMRKQVHPDTI